MNNHDAATNMNASSGNDSSGKDSAPSPIWWLYLLACADGRTYAGIALDVEARFRCHVQGDGAKFTRANPPLAILGVQSFANKSAALQAEYALKQLDKPEKLQWAQQWAYHKA